MAESAVFAIFKSTLQFVTSTFVLLWPNCLQFFLTYTIFFKWKPEITVQASVWSAPPIQSGDNVAECNRMKLVLTVIDNFQPSILKKFLFPYITPVNYWQVCCIILPW